MQNLSKWSLLKALVQDLHPAYFGVVMATGIVSIACKRIGLDEASSFLYALNLFQYAVLWCLLILRCFLFPQKVLSDLVDPGKGFGFFTIIAANSVVGLQVFFLGSSEIAAGYLWWASLCLWCLLIYPIFVGLITNEHKSNIDVSLNGGWLLAIVATQSVTVLGSTVPASISENLEVLYFILSSFWLFGTMLYIWIITLIFYRYMFFKFSPSDLMPPYWINMGAAAISSLAGLSMLDQINKVEFITELAPFIKGLSLMNWATATWWIPMLLFLGFWRHQIKKSPLIYNPLYWGLVFPLGMYAVCSYRLSLLFPSISFLIPLTRIFTGMALLAWTLTYLGLLSRIISPLVRLNKPAGQRSATHLCINIGRAILILGLCFYFIAGIFSFSSWEMPTIILLAAGVSLWFFGISKK